ncbi:hypothetical protein E4U12_003210 [Claviceps purpurea]|nr:hypothetical protein E4U12_003210 [Claviceps purpurea]
MATSRMASSVMYDDAQMATERPCPNFKDIVFWVQDKVPSRHFIIGLIELKITFGPKLATDVPPPSPPRASNASSSAPEPSRLSPVPPVSSRSCARPQGQQVLCWGRTPAATAPPPSSPRASNASSSAPEPSRLSPASSEPSPADIEEVVVRTEVDEKRKFIRDLILFSEEGGPYVDIHPEVGGQSLDLWELSQAVAAQQVPNDKVDWLNVAERLHFKRAKDGSLADELQAVGCA